MFTRFFNRPVRRRMPQPVLRLSRLDERIVPAGTITAVKTGTLLTLTGADTNSAADNQEIQLSGTNGNVMVSGLNGTLVNGQPFVFFNGINAATCNMKKGDDLVQAIGL